jgi:ABC-type lipoprotein release transport system permease subunit
MIAAVAWGLGAFGVVVGVPMGLALAMKVTGADHFIDRIIEKIEG